MNDKFEKAFELFLESRDAEKALDSMQESLRKAFAMGYRMGLNERIENDKKNNIEEARKELLEKK